MLRPLLFTSFISTLLLLSACRPDGSDGACTDLDAIAYAPTSYTIVPPQGLPPMEVPADNPMTVEGIRLGRHLFYDPILSVDGTISCASCHKIEKAFTDGKAVSEGVNGLVGRRSSMSLINVGYNWVRNRPHNFMWDGRFATLEEQAVQPIFDPVEMNNTAEKVLADLSAHPDYPTMFRQAFGISCPEDITMDMIGKAIAQFERTLNSADSKFDRDRWVPFEYMSSQELRGMTLFLGDAAGSPNAKDGECAHCHSFSPNRALFARNNFSNNGLDPATTFDDFIDKGFGEVTGRAPDNGKFREVTLRNIALTAPYMHDGRFATLEEVMDHYTKGLHAAPNLAAELSTAHDLPNLTDSEVDDIIAFMHALTDTSYVQGRPEWRSPF